MNRLSSVLADIVFFVAAAFAATLPLPARAAESYDNCTGYIDTVPATISTQGTWCLRRDLSTAVTNGFAIYVNNSNVTIDCNNFKIGGLAAGTGTISSAIYASNQFNLTVRRCNVRGFYIGIMTEGGGGHLFENNSLDGNTLIGLYAITAGSMIRGNRVLDTGGSTVDVGVAYGIYAASGVDVIDNTVTGMAATPDGGGNATVYGIYTLANGDGSVAGNRVRGLAASGTGTTYGIYNHSSGRSVARDNDVQGNGVAGSVGVRCSNNQATARDNVIAGFATGILNCLSDGDTVNPN